MLSRIQKKKIITKFGKNSRDTGNTAVQVALMTKKIKLLTKHLKNNKKDFVTQRNLRQKVTTRNRMLRYLANIDLNEYEKVCDELTIRKKFL